jgi:mono/diheme cytochrome c family protein
MRPLTITALAVASAIAGCTTLEEIAPPVEQLLVGRDAGRDVMRDDPTTTAPDASLLLHGRALYVVDCARCHAVVPVRAHTQAEWAEIMPRMVKESNLGAAEQRALEAYVDAVLSTPAARADRHDPRP